MTRPDFSILGTALQLLFPIPRFVLERSGPLGTLPALPSSIRPLIGRVVSELFHGAAMDAISLGLASALKYGIGAVKKATTASADSADKGRATSDFEATLKALLVADPANKVSEEDVFSALVQERIKAEKGEDALAKFQELLGQSKEAMKKPDGFIPVEDATKDALRKFRDSGEISKDESEKIYSQAFAAAQLDSNKGALFDNRGGPGDSSIAVSSLEDALLASRTKMTAFDDGSETAELRSLEEASAGKVFSETPNSPGSSSEVSSGGFLFKPVSDSDGRLAILLPPKLSGLVQSVRLVDKNGDPIESGRYAGNGNGGRDHYRFSRAGGGYPDGLKVEVVLKTQEIVRYTIKETSQRTENISPDTGSGSSNGSRNGNGDSSLGDDSASDNSL